MMTGILFIRANSPERWEVRPNGSHPIFESACNTEEFPGADAPDHPETVVLLK